MLEKTKLNIKESLMSKGLINSDVSHDEFVSVNNVLRGYNNMKKALKNLKITDSGNIIKRY